MDPTSMAGVGWVHETARSPEPARPMDWDEAQRWCNFVVMRPEGTRVEKATVRPEAPPGRRDGSDRPDWTESNRCCHRCEVRDGGRRLRIKQFLYDWTPPAFDHPSLWLSETSAFEAENDVGWLGRDFRGKRAASLHVDRTMVEVSVLEGAFGDAELIALCRSFTPAVPAVRARILGTSLAELSYQRRHDEPAIAEPLGFWKHRRAESDRCRALRADEAPVGFPAPEGFELDSVFVFGSRETDFVFESRAVAGRYVRILVGVSYPPMLDRQPCTSEVIAIDGREVHYAYRDPRYGPHEAVWQQDGSNLMLLPKPAPGADRAWFERLVRSIL